MTTATEESLTEDAMTRSFESAIRRLHRITGFVTVYGQQVDPRTRIFARFWHVRRVVRTLHLLARRRPGLNMARALMFAWLHDLNRWPFAHNLERGVFHQAPSTAQYLTEIKYSLPEPDDLPELLAIQNKVIEDLSPEAETVLLADAIAGMIEDPLFLITGLNVRPEVVPADQGRRVGLEPQREPWRSRCAELAAILRKGRQRSHVKAFQTGFDDLYLDQAKATIEILSDQTDLRGVACLEAIRTFKREVILPEVFPINNELVCRSSWMKSKVLPWYQARFDVADLVFLDEWQFVSRVVEAPGSPFVEGDFIPDLDAVARERPDLAFVR